MKMNATLTYPIAAVAYLIVLFTATPAVISWWYVLAFWLFSLFVFWVAPSTFGKSLPLSERTQLLLLIGGVLALVATRVVAFIHWGEAPFGYDTGIYLRGFEMFANGIEHNTLSLFGYLFALIGWSPVQLMTFGYVAVNILLGLAVYAATKEITNNTLFGIAALFVFALSLAQYEAFAWMFYRMMFSLVFLFATISLLAKRSWLAILTGAMIGILHPAVFLLFSIGYLLTIFIQMFIDRYQKNNIMMESFMFFVFVGVSILALTLIVNWEEIRGLMPYVTQYHLKLASVESYLSQELSGAYLDISSFSISALSYFPFALVGLYWLAHNFKKWSLAPRSAATIFILMLMIVVSIYITGEFIFFRRYLMVLDLVLILLSGIGVGLFIQYFAQRRLGMVVIVLLMTGFVSLTVHYAWIREPLISRFELEELQQVSEQMESDAYAMAIDPYYTPWVYGYLAEKTIAPGYFKNQWSQLEWDTFINDTSDQVRRELLARYGSAPIYVFVLSKQYDTDMLEEFFDKYGSQITTNVWRYQSSY